jgi:hypothetical protein
LAFGTIQTIGKENGLLLKNKLISIHYENAHLGTIFRDLIENYDVAIGLELSNLDSDHTEYHFETNRIYDNQSYSIDSRTGAKKKVEQRIFYVKTKQFTIKAENEPLENVLNEIVSQMKYYDWEINDDIVNIFPIEGRDEKVQELLNTKIKNYTLQIDKFAVNSLRIHALVGIINILPEIREFRRNNEIQVSIGANPPNSDRPFTETLVFSDLTLKELLNKITKHKRGGWHINYSKTGNIQAILISA